MNRIRIYKPEKKNRYYTEKYMAKKTRKNTGISAAKAAESAKKSNAGKTENDDIKNDSKNITGKENEENKPENESSKPENENSTLKEETMEKNNSKTKAPAAPESNANKSAESVITRKTKETSITLGLRLNGAGNYDVNTGVGFFDHMLEGFAKHGNFDLKIICKGDLNVDCHHTVEDVGIVLGQAIKNAVGNKEGMNRYATFIQPMDDALVLVSVDLCNRTYLNFDYDFKVERVGYFETETVKEFFRAVADEAGMNIHIKVLDGTNTHHIIEATFKAFANALAIAVSDSGRVGVLSTKGAL